MSSNTSPDPDQLLNTADAAAKLGKHPAVLADWRHQRRGPKYIQFGRSIRYRIGDLNDWIAEFTVEPASR